MIEVLTPATLEDVIPLQRFRDHARITLLDEAALLERYLLAAARTVERATGRPIGAQTWRITVPIERDGTAILPFLGPVTTLSAVAAVDDDGVAVTGVPAVGDFRVDAIHGGPSVLRILSTSVWPTTATRAVITVILGTNTLDPALEQEVLDLALVLEQRCATEPELLAVEDRLYRRVIGRFADVAV